MLLTGHTGFKGSWTAIWLHQLGARVFGLSLPPPTTPSLFESASVAELLAEHTIGDVRDLAVVEGAVERARPDLVLHMAAQPLVRESYRNPVETFATNVLGTVHVLEAVRTKHPSAATVVVTTDKCYEEQPLGRGYREDDRLGGHDPYSASKAGAELVAASCRRSFGLRIATARAGNVIGGGDWANDRIVVDAMRALLAGQPIPVRNARATRPFQHVLDPVSGYLRLSTALLEDPKWGSGWNFGPAQDSAISVQKLVETILRHYGSGTWVDRSEPNAVHEAAKLTLDASRARELGWEPRWDLERAIERTVSWYRAVHQGAGAREHSLADIAAYGAP